MLSSLFKKSRHQAAEVEDLFAREVVVHVPEAVPTPPREESESEQEDENREGRVVFVGNVHLNATSKEIEALFRPFGKVDKVWFRSLPVDRKNTKIPIKAAVIIKQYQEGAQVKNCYVLFQKAENALASLELNNTVYRDFHLRVDLVDRKKRELTNTVFIGNVPFAAQEEAIRSVCEELFGDVESVRLIRDRVSRQGKGFGYVKFSKFRSFKKALLAATFKFEEREVRITKAQATKGDQQKEKAVLNNAHNANKRIQKKQEKNMKQTIITQKIRKSIRKMKKSQVTPKTMKGRVQILKRNLTESVRDTNIFNRK